MRRLRLVAQKLSACHFSRLNPMLAGVVQHSYSFKTTRRLHQVVLTSMPAPAYFSDRHVMPGLGSDSVPDAANIDFPGHRSDKHAVNNVASAMRLPAQAWSSLAGIGCLQAKRTPGVQTLRDTLINNSSRLALVADVIIATQPLGNTVGIKEGLRQLCELALAPCALAGAICADDSQKPRGLGHCYPKASSSAESTKSAVTPRARSSDGISDT